MLPWPLLALALTAQDPSRGAEMPIQITLKRTPCFGECPDYTVTIDGEGIVTYEGRQFVRVTGKQTARIDRAAVRRLIDEFNQIGFFSLKDKYSASVTDLPTTYVTLKIGDRSKTVQDYFGTPTSLRDLERHIDEAAGVRRWIRIEAGTVKELVRTGWRAAGRDGEELLRNAVLYDETEVVAALIDAGPDVNGESGTTPLMLARSATAAKVLIRAGANVHVRAGGVGATPLSMSIYRDPGVTRAMLDAGASADDTLGQAPLFLATCLGNAEAVDMLLRAGASPDRPNRTARMTPVQCVEQARKRPASPLEVDTKPPFVKGFDRVLALLDRALASKR